MKRSLDYPGWAVASAIRLEKYEDKTTPILSGLTKRVKARRAQKEPSNFVAVRWNLPLGRVIQMGPEGKLKEAEFIEVGPDPDHGFFPGKKNKATILGAPLEDIEEIENRLRDFKLDPIQAAAFAYRGYRFAGTVPGGFGEEPERVLSSYSGWSGITSHGQQEMKTAAFLEGNSRFGILIGCYSKMLEALFVPESAIVLGEHVLKWSLASKRPNTPLL